MLEVALTVAAVALALTQPIPQIARIVRTRSIAGVSGPSAWLGLVINAAWMTYGIGRGLVPVAVLSTAYVVGYGLTAALLVRSGNRRGPISALVAAVALAGVATTAGWAALGTTLALTVGVQFLPQVVEAWRSTDLAGLAPGTYVVCLLDGLVWGGYGMLVVDTALLLYGAVMISVAIAVLVPRLRWSRSLDVIAN